MQSWLFQVGMASNCSPIHYFLTSISCFEKTYSMDAYFRQTWVDERLRFSGDINVLVLHIKLLHEIWKPDTYFYNGQGSYVHMTTTPNKLLRIKQDGSVLYSMRLVDDNS